VTKTQSVGPISCLEHRATRALHCTTVTRAAVLMFPLLLQSIISNQALDQVSLAPLPLLYCFTVKFLTVLRGSVQRTSRRRTISSPSSCLFMETTSSLAPAMRTTVACWPPTDTSSSSPSTTGSACLVRRSRLE